MSVVVYVESAKGKYKKSALEAVTYAKKVADLSGTDVKAVAIHSDAPAEELYAVGANKVINLTDDSLKSISPDAYGKALAAQIDGEFIVLTHTNDGQAIAPFIAVEKDATLVTNVITAPSSVSPFVAKRKAFSGKGIMTFEAQGAVKVITVLQGAINVEENAVGGSAEAASSGVSAGVVSVTGEETAGDVLDLKEADLVVSAGRGMKGPENWGMIEELAKLIGAATACSKPCADIGWRPHSEHVGQTGKAISPKLYIAVGISGAIQHLAGVGSSDVIVVINSDPEAPFFKSADYGIVGDAFEVVPKLIEEIKKLKNA
ncbi:MAG: electron transfer flavoprotein subunit alpha [Flavobacteriaceae bacterium]|nr:MAG: electron transfer flavoprotein subunit alpha [Flavobacteriaceae bacterium]